MSQTAGTWSEVSLQRSAPDRESAIEDCQVQVSRTAMSAIPARSPSRDSKSDDWASRVHKQPFIPGDRDRERLGDPARGSATVPRGVGVGGAVRDPRQSWDNLRLHSPNQHAKAHCQEAGHPVTAGLAPGSAWRSCYVHQRLV